MGPGFCKPTSTQFYASLSAHWLVYVFPGDDDDDADCC